MLKPAQLYKDVLEEKMLYAWYDMKNIYYSGWTGASMPNLPDNNYDEHNFVSVDKDNNVIGYISYSVNWLAMSADNFGIISFDKGSLLFPKDVYHVICNLFNTYHMNRISWLVYADNPVLRSYRRFIKKHGGRECGYFRQAAKLQDGLLHDRVHFEILAEEFKQ